MKLFIVAAALVACVAGQTSMDILKLNKDARSMLKFDRPSYPMAYGYDYGYTNRMNMYDDVDTTSTYNNYYNYDNNVLTYEEMMVHPRFQEYMTLPLFRQYWNSSPIFQRYVCSVFFQRFWHIPAFKTYFVSPVLFYKYVYPCVQLFKYNYDTTSTTSYPFAYDTQENMYNNQYPMVCRYNTVYCKTVVENLYQHLYSMMMRMSQQDQEMVMPYNYNYNTNSMYNNPIIAKMMYGLYNKQYYPSMYNYNNNRFPSTYETDNTNTFNYNNMFDFDTLRMPNRMVQDMPTVNELKFESIRPIQKIPVGMKTFEDKVIPEVIKA